MSFSRVKNQSMGALYQNQGLCKEKAQSFTYSEKSTEVKAPKYTFAEPHTAWKHSLQRACCVHLCDLLLLAFVLSPSTLVQIVLAEKLHVFVYNNGAKMFKAVMC